MLLTKIPLKSIYKMNKKLLLIVISGLLAHLNLAAQENLVSGYILKSSTDTVYGYIDDINYHHNSKYCDFSLNKTDSIIRYYPEDIFGYRFINGKYYVSKNIEIDDINVTLFMEYLIDGELDFYFRQDESKINHFYVSKNDSALTELLYSKEILNIEGKMYELEKKQYANVLGYYTSKYPEFKTEILDLGEPTHKNLISFGEDYHNYVCKDRKCIIYDKQIKYRILFEFTGGNKLFHFQKDHYRSQKTIFYGANLYVNNPRFSEKSYFGFGYIFEGKSIIDSSGVTYNNFKIPFTYGYSSSQPGLSATFQGGINIRNYDEWIFTSFSVSPGLKYNFEKFFIKAYVDMEFYSIAIIPVFYHSTNFGISLVYKLN